MTTARPILHTVNKSPFAGATLEACVARLGDGASLLLIEDGVYAALADGAFAGRLGPLGQRRALYALGPDLAARGLLGRPLVDGLQIIDYPGFVQLAATHAAVHAWF